MSGNPPPHPPCGPRDSVPEVPDPNPFPWVPAKAVHVPVLTEETYLDSITFSPLHPTPVGVKWGSSLEGGIDIPEKARRLAWIWTLYDIARAIEDGDPVNVADINEAFVLVFSQK